LQCTITNNKHQHSEDFLLDLNGMYQVNNLCTVLCAEGILLQQGYTISNTTEKLALANVKKLTGLYGRWQVIQQNPLLVLDVAHNEDGIKQVLLQLNTFYPNKNYHFIIGMVNDKDVHKVLQILPSNAQYYFTNAAIPRALPAAELQTVASNYQLKGNCYSNVNEAIDRAKKIATIADIIIVCGSVFLVAEVNN
jgi:dihydrofolate synthase/folylpolyglutamate synthase